MIENACEQIKTGISFASIDMLAKFDKEADATDLAEQLIAHLRICDLCRQYHQSFVGNFTYAARDERIFPKDNSKPWEVTPAPPSPSSR